MMRRMPPSHSASRIRRAVLSAIPAVAVKSALRKIGCSKIQSSVNGVAGTGQLRDAAFQAVVQVDDALRLRQVLLGLHPHRFQEEPAPPGPVAVARDGASRMTRWDSGSSFSISLARRMAVR